MVYTFINNKFDKIFYDLLKQKLRVRLKISHLSDIEGQMKKTMEEIGEKIVLEKEKSIQNFLQALVRCGEISPEKKESIESNVSLEGFFMKDLDENFLEDEGAFEGRYT